MAPPLYASIRNPWHLMTDCHPGGGEHHSNSHGSNSRGISSSGSRSSHNSASSRSHRHHHHHHHHHHQHHNSDTSVQRATALELVAAFNRNNIEAQTILAFLVPAPGFVREVLPRSLGQAAGQQGVEGFQRALNMYRAVFRHYALDVLEVVDDVAARKVCLWLTARARTVAGEYVCDMVWTLTFDETGRRVVRWKEFLDSGARITDLLPETMAGGAGE